MVNITLIAILSSAAFTGLTHLLFPADAPIVFSCFLALTACVYGGAALTPAGVKYGRVELPVVGLVFITAVMGVAAGPIWLVAGYTVHGLWDILHHFGKVNTPIVGWFPPLCAVFDFVLATAIYLWWV